MADTTMAFYEAKSATFSEIGPSDEYLHPAARQYETGPELTETQFLGFNIPEHDIMAIGYLWHHPNLGVLSGGAWAWQGVKPSSLSCEMFDFLTYVDDSVLADDLHDVTLPNSYRSRVIEPLKRLRITYCDEAHGHAFDVEYEALAPPMVLDTGCHLEQPMRTRGWLELAGRRHEVDGHTVRDRSWGQLRHEGAVDMPPLSWTNGVFGPDLSFGVTAFDTEDRDPEWKGALTIPGGDPLRAGWICRDGQYSPVAAVSKRTYRNPVTLLPEKVDIELIADDGFRLELAGTITASTHWRTWHNMDTLVCLVRWESDGRITHGDFQDVLYQPYVSRFAQPAVTTA